MEVRSDHDPLEAGDGATEYLDRARSDVVRGSMWTAIATSITLPVTFVANIIVAHALGPADLGRLATYIAAFTLLSALGNLGWSEATVQWLASANAHGKQIEGAELISRCAGYHLVVAGPFAAIAAFATVASAGLGTALAVAAIVWLTQAAGTSTVVLTAGARNATSAQIALGVSTATQLALATTAVATGAPALTWLLQLAVTAVGPLLAVCALRSWERRALLRPRLSLSLPAGFMSYAFSACAAGLVATLVFGRSEIFVLRAHGLLAEVGVFTVVTALAAQLTGPLDSLMAPLTPIAAGIYAIDQERARRAFARALRVSAALGTFAAAVIVPIGVTVVEPLYGADFSAGVIPLLALGLVSCLQTVIGPVAAFAFATRSAAQVLRVNLVCLALDAMLAISLIPLVGLAGAVVANASAQVAGLVLLTRVVSRRLGVPVSDMLREARLFTLGLFVGLLEGLVCATLDGTARAFAVAVLVAGSVMLWLALRAVPGLRLLDGDLAFITRGGSNRWLAAAVGLLWRAGLVRKTS